MIAVSVAAARAARDEVGRRPPTHGVTSQRPAEAVAAVGVARAVRGDGAGRVRRGADQPPVDAPDDLWPYFAVFALVFGDAVIAVLPGETTLNTASTLAAQGVLELGWVMVAGAVGAVLGDSALYWIARSFRPRVQPRLDAALKNPKVATARGHHRLHGHRAARVRPLRAGHAVRGQRQPRARRAPLPGLRPLVRARRHPLVGLQLLGRVPRRHRPGRRAAGVDRRLRARLHARRARSSSSSSPAGTAASAPAQGASISTQRTSRGRCTAPSARRLAVADHRGDQVLVALPRPVPGRGSPSRPGRSAWPAARRPPTAPRASATAVTSPPVVPGGVQASHSPPGLTRSVVVGRDRRRSG